MENIHTILKGCIRNEQKYQKMLYENYYAYAFKVAFRYIYRYEKVPDIVNDGFVKLFKSINSFDRWTSTNIEASFLSWLKRIIVNTAIDELRRNSMIPEIGNIDDANWQEPHSYTTTDQSLLYKDVINQIKRLPPAYRAVFNMYVIDGFDHQEIADRLGIAVGTSKSNLFKARAYLQKLLLKENQQTGTCNT